MGSAVLPPEGSPGDTTVVRGRDLKTGRPTEISVTAREIAEALGYSVDCLVSAVQDVLLHLPAEFAGDIQKTGIRHIRLERDLWLVMAFRFLIQPALCIFLSIGTTKI